MKLYVSEGLPPLSNDDIQKIGIEYYGIYDKSGDSKKELEIAHIMMEYKDPGNLLLKWLHFFNYYHRADKDSKLSEIIKNKIEESFDDDIEEVIRTVTYERGILGTYLYGIGARYLELYPDKQKGFFGFELGGHTNQKAAKKLIEESNKYIGSQSWIRLYLIYKSLPNDKGGLASDIRFIFSAHFHEPFETTVKALHLDEKTEADLKVLSDIPESLSLPQEAEEQLLRLQAEQLFRKKDINLNLIEDMGIFWVNRSPYLRIVATGGVTICVPVAAGIFLTANVYALIAMGVLIGGGLFVLELVGHTGLKIESVPDSFLEVLKGNHIALSLSARAVTEGAKQVQANLSSVTELAKEQEVQLLKMTSQVETLQRVAAAFMQTKGEEEDLANTLKGLTSGNRDIARDLLDVDTELKKENAVLKETVKELKDHERNMLSCLQQLQEIISESSGNKEQLDQMTRAFQQLARSANIQIVPALTSKAEKSNPLVEASKRLYRPDESVDTRSGMELRV